MDIENIKIACRAEHIVDDMFIASDEKVSADEYWFLVKEKYDELVSDNKNGIIYNKWILCTEDNYWQTERDIVAINISDELFYFSRRECPYGWNILYRNNAMIFTPLECPIFN